MTDIVSKYIEVCVYRRSGDQIKYLVLKRSSDVVIPNIWQFITGSIDEGEKAYEAAYREFSEETGLTPKNFLIAPDIAAFYRHDNDTMNLIAVFIAETETEDVTLCNEHCEYKWLDYNGARELLHWFDQKENLRKINGCITDAKLYKSLVKINIKEIKKR